MTGRLLAVSSPKAHRKRAELLAGLSVRTHDFDENGVPDGADSAWRQRTGEEWIRRALVYERRGVDLLLSGNLPLGEVLAAPSAPQLDGIALCLIDCGDLIRVERLRARNHSSYTEERIWDFVLFAAWQRLHHADPAWMPQVITRHSPAMAWDRWTSWTRFDPRWSVATFDTSEETVEVSAHRTARWIRTQIELRDQGKLPLRDSPSGAEEGERGRLPSADSSDAPYGLSS
jgi:hypothetical protein